MPIIVMFAVFSWWPIVRSVAMSVQKTNFIVTEWVGWSNFERVLADPMLGKAVWNTVQFTAWSVVIGFPVPVLVAVVIAELRRARGFASALAYLPVIVPPVVAVLLWRALYDPSPQGALNSVMGWLGIPPAAWLNNADIAIPAIVVEMTWASFGSATIIYLATLMTIRTELYEAAELDGASILGRVWHVTLPQMRGILLIMFLLQILSVFQLFTEPWVMTGGGPANGTLTVMILIYRYAFVAGDYGRATALSLLLAVALGILSAVYLAATRRWSRT
ncbi:MAG: sugar ABC transporter permease [Bifidobacteriaceae bacterium]|nr:sugar ABC transporter permease [Bifidobacteriaceae bacterium]